MDKLRDILVMKVGYHGQETIEQIVARKLAEETCHGAAYWGYGGTLCHPHKVVQPYASALQQHGREVTALFVATPSPFASDVGAAREFSMDGLNWEPLQGPQITASKYALILKNLRPCYTELNLAEYEVSAGPSAGRPLSDYLRFRVDKALATRTESDMDDTGAKVIVSFMAELAFPFAISVRPRPLPA